MAINNNEINTYLESNLEKIGETAVLYSIEEVGKDSTKNISIIQVPKIIKKSGMCYDIFENHKRRYKKIILVNHNNNKIMWNVYEADKNKENISIFASNIIKEFSAASAWRTRLKYVLDIENLFLHPLSIEKFATNIETNITNAFGYRKETYYDTKYELEYDVNDPIAKHIENTISDEKTFNKIKIDHSRITDIIKEVHNICKKNTNGYYILGWSMMSMCRLDILDKFQIFPTLGLFGVKGAGKSTLGTLFISNLWGAKKQESSNILEGTGIRFEVLKGSTKPISIDEAKKINFEILRELSTSKYISRKRGTRTGQVLEREISRPIAVNGNEIIFPREDGSSIISANLSRFQFLKFDKAMGKNQINLSYHDMMMLGKFIIENILPKFNIEKLMQFKKETIVKESRNAEVIAIREYGIELVKELFKNERIDPEIPSYQEVNIEEFAKTPGKKIYDTLFAELEKIIFSNQYGITTWRDVAYIINQNDSKGLLANNNTAIMKKLENKGIFFTIKGNILLTKQSLRTLETTGTMKSLFDDMEESKHDEISFVEYVMKGRNRNVVVTKKVQNNEIIHVKKTGIVLHLNTESIISDNKSISDQE